MQKVQKIYKVINNKKLCQQFFHLCLKPVSAIPEIKPGQFIHIKVSQGLEPVFRRPFSVARAGKNVEVIYEVVGKGTEILSQKKPGEILDVLGPLGNSFCKPPKGVKQVVMIGGGVGVAPLLALSDVLKGRGYEMVLLYGGRIKGHTFNMRTFCKNGCKVYVATEDGSVGIKGRVDKLYTKIKANAKETFIYTCGPRPMMASVAAFARKHGVQGQVSCEEVMACGVGTCLGCAIETRSGYKTVCDDGPVFDINEIF
ncbi:MAG: dihydroorotate dehydrogenase electron transfer subunit [Candidatus Omnitrophica bacterium]|nr:dihydroorotate dehydrogenase electron transfer subunit [Candidatus Omnitrophota bacterium]